MNNDGDYKLPEVRDCMGYENLGSVEIRLSDLDSFVSYATEWKVDTIWSCYGPICNKFKAADGKLPDFERENPHSEIFFFVRDKEIYSVESEGFRRLSDYTGAKEMGFLHDSAYRLLDYISKKYIEESVASLYYNAVRYGFENFKEFNESYRFYDEFEPAGKFREESYLLKELEFKKKYDWEIANAKGFEKGQDYYDAVSMGIKNSCEYKDFKILTEKLAKYGFESPFEFHIFHIISRLRGGQSLGLDSLRHKLLDESYYYHKDWYNVKRGDITVEKLQTILVTNKKFSKIGRLIENSGDLAYSLYRNDTIYVDGSNVAWNNGTKRHGNLPHARNIKTVVKKLREIGFKEVQVLCDNNIFDDVDDKDIYKELSQTGILNVVQKGNVADEWILKFKGDKDRFIISNDKFRQYSKNYPDINDHRIDFQVVGEEAMFDDRLSKIVDGILPDGELPKLCYQSERGVEN